MKIYLTQLEIILYFRRISSFRKRDKIFPLSSKKFATVLLTMRQFFKIYLSFLFLLSFFSIYFPFLLSFFYLSFIVLLSCRSFLFLFPLFYRSFLFLFSFFCRSFPFIFPFFYHSFIFLLSSFNLLIYIFIFLLTVSFCFTVIHFERRLSLCIIGLFFHRNSNNGFLT